VFSRNGNGILVSAFNVDIKKHDILTLENGKWLNDEIINFYAQLIMDRAKTKFCKVHVYNTFFYSTLCQGGYSKVKKWSKKVSFHQLIL
jgi:Ulp1 family protease